MLEFIICACDNPRPAGTRTPTCAGVEIHLWVSRGQVVSYPRGFGYEWVFTKPAHESVGAIPRY